MQELGLEQIDNTAELETAVKKIIKKNPQQLAQYRGGKINVIQFFIGQVMAETRGKANPKIVQKLLEKLLK
jgi:aspartyl-tRNA(Asn)/glutamyl-tRNA(Gln) amidotransferase subunit B